MLINYSTRCRKSACEVNILSSQPFISAVIHTVAVNYSVSSCRMASHGVGLRAGGKRGEAILIGLENRFGSIYSNLNAANRCLCEDLDHSALGRFTPSSFMP